MGTGGLKLAGAQLSILDFCGPVAADAETTEQQCACACVSVHLCACGSAHTGCPSVRDSAHLGLDLLGCVGEEDGGVGVTGTHFGLGPLQGGEEGRVQQGWLRIANPRGDVSRHPEVRILWGEGLLKMASMCQLLAQR